MMADCIYIPTNAAFMGKTLEFVPQNSFDNQKSPEQITKPGLETESSWVCLCVKTKIFASKSLFISRHGFAALFINRGSDSINGNMGSKRGACFIYLWGGPFWGMDGMMRKKISSAVCS